MKTIKTWLATIAVLFCCITANAEDFSVNGIYYNITSTTDLTVEVTFQGSSVSSVSEYIGAVAIPETVTYSNRQYRVTSIGEDAFHDCYDLTSVSIPKSVTSIGKSVFFNCRSLTSVNIPEGVEILKEGVFGNCLILNFITIPESVTEIGGYAFTNCESLTSITIPENVTKIGSIAFDGCSNLTSITIPESVAEIGHSAFRDCYKLTAVHISSIEAWCKIAFEDDDSNPLFYGGNLYLNENLVANLCIPESVTSIRNYAFSGCGSLTSISIPESVTEIGEGAFQHCI